MKTYPKRLCYHSAGGNIDVRPFRPNTYFVEVSAGPNHSVILSDDEVRELIAWLATHIAKLEMDADIDKYDTGVKLKNSGY